jgi:hypothetical protein
VGHLYLVEVALEQIPAAMELQVETMVVEVEVVQEAPQLILAEQAHPASLSLRSSTNG